MRKYIPIISISIFFALVATVWAVDRKERILLDVPFIVQAPTANWADMRFQDGCEETASLMAVKWARGEKATTSRVALARELLAIANWEKKKYGSYVDTSASSTGDRILKGYFKFKNFQYREKITKADIIDELAKGNILIVPTNGRKLKNPYFTDGGPDEHMVVVKGYDPILKQFITNDPGTKRGNGFRYGEDLFYDAIRDYPTGNHKPIKGAKKNALIISKEFKK